MSPALIEAVILDLDGVITRTATTHARAWKKMFDEYLRQRATRDDRDFVPFTMDDYRSYVDGKPRYDGVESFLQSRGITLPRGEPDDPPTRETVCGLGNRKNEAFNEALREEGVEVFDDAIERIRNWRDEGLKTAVVSSSRNCLPIIQAANIEHLFDARVDGVIASELGLPGKPAPDTFLEAARRIGVEPAHAAVFEDAEAGVQAGRAGAFGLVVGVDREGHAQSLKEHGAEIVVRDLRQVRLRVKGQEQ